MRGSRKFIANQPGGKEAATKTGLKSMKGKASPFVVPAAVFAAPGTDPARLGGQAKVTQGLVAPLPSGPHLRNPLESTWKRVPE